MAAFQLLLLRLLLVGYSPQATPPADPALVSQNRKARIVPQRADGLFLAGQAWLETVSAVGRIVYLLVVPELC